MKISKEARAEKTIQFNKVVLDLFLENGSDALTYHRVARELDVRKSTVQRYYPHKNAFFNSIQGILSERLLCALDTTDRDSLITSWIKCHEDIPFRYIAEMIVSHTVSGNCSEAAVHCVHMLKASIVNVVKPEAVNDTLCTLFGFTSMRSTLK